MMRPAWRGLLSGTLPGSRTHGFAVLALFAVVQAADVTLTLSGVSRFGVGIESNPLLAASMRVLGVTGALVTAKAIAVLLATVLSAVRAYTILTLLMVLYVFAALIPWALALSF